MIRTVTLPHLQLFGVSDGLELRVSVDRQIHGRSCSFQPKDKEAGLLTPGRR